MSVSKYECYPVPGGKPTLHFKVGDGVFFCLWTKIENAILGLGFTAQAADARLYCFILLSF